MQEQQEDSSNGLSSSTSPQDVASSSLQEATTSSIGRPRYQKATTSSIGRPRYQKAIWTDAENRKLTALVRASGDKVNWHDISAAFNHRRSAKRCRERWVEYLNPALSNAPFTAEEDNIVLTYQARYGNKWKKISDALKVHKRSPTAVKLRFFALQREEGRDVQIPVQATSEIDTAIITGAPPAFSQMPSDSPIYVPPVSNDGGLNYWLSQQPPELSDSHFIDKNEFA